MDFLNNLAGSVIKFPETIEEKTEISKQFENVNEKHFYKLYIKCILSKNFLEILENIPLISLVKIYILKRYFPI